MESENSPKSASREVLFYKKGWSHGPSAKRSRVGMGKVDGSETHKEAGNRGIFRDESPFRCRSSFMIRDVLAKICVSCRILQHHQGARKVRSPMPLSVLFVQYR